MQRLLKLRYDYRINNQTAKTNNKKRFTNI